MELYLLTRLFAPEDTYATYDANDGFVVLATDAKEARKIAAEEKKGDEPAVVWLSPKMSSCRKISCKGKPRIILTSYHAG